MSQPRTRPTIPGSDLRARFSRLHPGLAAGLGAGAMLLVVLGLLPFVAFVRECRALMDGSTYGALDARPTAAPMGAAASGAVPGAAPTVPSGMQTTVQPGGVPEGPEPALLRVPAGPVTPLDREAAQGWALGDRDAPVLVEEFADFQCPACAAFASAGGIAEIKRRLVDTGRARFVFYDYPLPYHTKAQLAATAARCAGEQDRFWPMHDRLYQAQAEWSVVPRARAAERFTELAAELGVNRRRFASCLQSNRHVGAIQGGYTLGGRMGITGTPMFYVNGKPVANAVNAIEQAVQAAGSTTLPQSASGADDSA